MSLANNIIVISESPEDGNRFREICQSGLLRDIDNIICVNYEKSLELSKKYLPDAIVIYAYEKAYNALNICKQLKFESCFKNTPILLVLDTKDDEIILSAYDEGVTDYILPPASATDIIVRLMWCLKKNEIIRELEKKEVLLRSIGVVDKSTEAFAAEFTEKAFKAEINIAQKYGYKAVVMVLSLDLNEKDRLNYDYLALTIKNAIRTRDLIGLSSDGKIYLFFPKTDVKGACTVYNKIVASLKQHISISAGVCDFNEEMSYETVVKNAENALAQALKRGGKRIIIAEPRVHEDKPSADWLSRIHNDKKDYTSYREKLSYKFKTVVEPVFYKIKAEMEISDCLNLEYSITDSKCIFEINRIYQDNGILIKISETGISKVNIEVLDKKTGQSVQERKILNLEELDEQNLNKIIYGVLEAFNFKNLI